MFEPFFRTLTNFTFDQLYEFGQIMTRYDFLVARLIESPVRSTYGGYYGLVVVPRPQTLHRSHDNLKNPYRIASIFYM